MSDKYENPKNYPIDAAYQVALEMAKAGTFTGSSDKGASFVTAFTKIKKCFEELKNEETNQQ